jgi:hypothetical protein
MVGWNGIMIRFLVERRIRLEKLICIPIRFPTWFPRGLPEENGNLAAPE